MPVFMFTDIENSSQLWEKRPAAMADALAHHDALLQAQVEAHGGRMVKHLGDGIFAVFEEGNPLQCALDIQDALSQHYWGSIGFLNIRIALHAGEAFERNDDYFGPAVNRTARLLETAWGGQTFFTPEVLACTDAPAMATITDLGVYQLRDLDTPQQIYGLTPASLGQHIFPPIRTQFVYTSGLSITATPAYRWLIPQRPVRTEIEQMLPVQ